MSTKNNPGPFDCYANASSDEPMFILLARDKSAPEIVRRWAADFRARKMVLGEWDAAADAKYDEALNVANAMHEWRLTRDVKTRLSAEIKADAAKLSNAEYLKKYGY